jgi:hypothetical protein
MSELIIFGSIGFWIGLIIAIGLIIYFLESALSDDRDNGGGFKATLVVGGFILLYFLFGSREHVIDGFKYIGSHTGTILFLFGLYIAAGVAWAFAKWYFFLLSKREELAGKIKSMYVDSTTDASKFIPTANKNKARIISWMTYWPFSGLWTLVNDPVKKAFQVAYGRVESYFDRISNSMFADQKLALEEKISQRKREQEERDAQYRNRK